MGAERLIDSEISRIVTYVIADEAAQATVVPASAAGVPGADTWDPAAAPDPSKAIMVMPAPGTGSGAWVGSPSAVRVDGEIFIAYRLRTAHQRGYAIEVARSADGVAFRPLVRISKDQMGAESLERPALAVAADGTWRLYLSCATPGTKHWRVELVQATAPDRFDPGTRQVLLPGDSARAVKDPVVLRHG